MSAVGGHSRSDGAAGELHHLPGPGGFATPDDLQALEACHAGFRAGAGVPWSDISRGMHRKHSGQSCRGSDERQMRAFWRQWQKLMSAG
jgi:hypothetical protein